MTLLALVDAVIQQQAERPPTKVSASFADVLTALYAAGFTGRVYVDFAEGQPRQIQLPNPIGVRIRSN